MAPVQDITPAERIRELSDINRDVAALLASAAQAVNALTNRPLDTHIDGDDTRMSDGAKDSLDDRKKAFEDNSSEFFHGVQGVMARLRRQAYALEEAGIITPDQLVATAGTQHKVKAPPPQQGLQRGIVVPPTQQLDPERIRNGGLGNLDVGWLNSRGNKVGAEKEAELVQEAKELLEEVLSREHTTP